MAQFATGNPYGSGGAGVGAYIIEDNRNKATDAFATAYDNSLRWKQVKEAEKAAKRKELEDKLKDLDFKTDGIRPMSVEFFRDAKIRMQEDIANSWMRGNGTMSTPDYMKALRTQEEMEALVNGDVAVNKAMNETLERARANPDKYNLDEVEQWYRKVYNAPIVAPDAKRFSQDYRQQPGDDTETYINTQTQQEMPREKWLDIMVKGHGYSRQDAEKYFDEGVAKGQMEKKVTKGTPSYQKRIGDDQWQNITEQEYKEGGMSANQLAQNPPLPIETSYYDIVKDWAKEPTSTVVIEEDGKIIQKTGYGEWNKTTGMFETDNYILNNYRNSPKAQDIIEEEWFPVSEDAVNDQSQTQAYSASIVKAVSDLATLMGKNGTYVTPTEAFAILRARDHLPYKDESKGETAEEKMKQSAYWKAYYGKGGVGQSMMSYEGDYWRALQTLTGKVVYAKGDDGELTSLYAPTRFAGKFDAKNMKGLDNMILDFRYSTDPTGKSVYKYRTSQTALNKSDQQYRITSDPGEVLQMLSNKYKEKSGQWMTGFEAFAKAQGVWDYANKTVDLKKASELFADEEPVDLKAIKEREAVLTKQKDMITSKANLDTLIQRGNLPLLPKQKQVYDAWVAKHGRQPDDAKVKQILQSVQE